MNYEPRKRIRFDKTQNKFLMSKDFYWDFDMTLAKFIVDGLTQFKQYIDFFVPTTYVLENGGNDELAQERYKKDIDRVVQIFTDYLKNDGYELNLEKLDEGFTLLKKIFPTLWW